MSTSFILLLYVIVWAWLAFRRKTLDRKDALFGYLALVVGTWAAVFIAPLIPNQEYATAYGQQVFVFSSCGAIILSAVGFLLYLLRRVELPQISIVKHVQHSSFQNAFTIRFDYIIKTSKASIEGLEVHIASGYGRPSGQTWANLDLRKYEQNEAVIGKAGEFVTQLPFLANDSKQFTFVTFVITPKEGGGIKRRAYMKVVGTSRRSEYDAVIFGSPYPRIWIRFIGLPERLEKQYIIVYNDPPWADDAIDKAVELLEADSERAKRLIAEYNTKVRERKNGG